MLNIIGWTIYIDDMIVKRKEKKIFILFLDINHNGGINQILLQEREDLRWEDIFFLCPGFESRTLHILYIVFINWAKLT